MLIAGQTFVRLQEIKVIKKVETRCRNKVIDLLKQKSENNT